MREDDRHKAKENKYQQIAPSKIGKMSSVKKTEKDTKGSDDEKFPLHVEQENAQSHQTGKNCHDANAPLHGTRRNPTLRASPFRTETVFTVCTFPKIEIVIDEIGINLHQDGKKETKKE